MLETYVCLTFIARFNCHVVFHNISIIKKAYHDLLIRVL